MNHTATQGEALPLNRIQQLKPGHVLQFHVEHHGLVNSLGEPLQDLTATGSDIQVHTGSQHPTQGRGSAGVIFGQQYTRH